MKFILNINNEHAQDYSCRGELLRSVHMEESYLSKAGLVQRVTRLSKLPRDNKNTSMHSYRRQTVHQSKVDPGVSELPWGNEMHWDHVNRP